MEQACDDLSAFLAFLARLLLLELPALRNVFLSPTLRSPKAMSGNFVGVSTQEEQRLLGSVALFVEDACTGKRASAPTEW